MLGELRLILGLMRLRLALLIVEYLGLVDSSLASPQNAEQGNATVRAREEKQSRIKRPSPSALRHDRALARAVMDRASSAFATYSCCLVTSCCLARSSTCFSGRGDKARGSIRASEGGRGEDRDRRLGPDFGGGGGTGGGCSCSPDRATGRSHGRADRGSENHQPSKASPQTSGRRSRSFPTSPCTHLGTVRGGVDLTDGGCRSLERLWVQ